MPLASQAAIGIVFSENKKKVLLIKRRDVPIWVLPGGGVDFNENPDDAVIRELFEETGLRTSLLRKVGSYSPAPPFATQTEVYECGVINGDLAIGEETTNVGFFGVDALPVPFFPVHQYWIDDALLMKATPIKKPVPGVGWGNFAWYLLTHPFLIGRYLLARMGFPYNTK